MTLLNELPIDVLAEILQYSEAIDLFKTGNKRIMMLLASGGSRTVQLRDYLWNTTSRFPKCLTLFRGLRSLHIVRGRYRLMDSEAFGLALQQLSTLESLKIECKEAMHAFLIPTSPADLFRLVEAELSIEKDAQPSSLPHHRIWSLKSAFPRLTTLSINSPFTRTFVWHKSDLLLLPDSLTHLKLPTFEEQGHTTYENLPQGLLHLNLGYTIALSKESAKALPPGLTSIVWRSSFDYQEVMPYFPKSLTHWPTFSGMNWTVKSASGVPPLISSLTIKSVSESSFSDHIPGGSDSGDSGIHNHIQTQEGSSDLQRSAKPSSQIVSNSFLERASLSSWDSALPRYLVDLRFDDGSSWPMDRYKLALLPKTLKRLELYLMDWSGLTPETASFPDLIRLRIVETQGFTKECAQALPQTLTELLNFKSRSVIECGMDSSLIPHFPRQIQSWSMLLIGDELAEAPKGLPTTLQKLQISPGRTVPPIGFSSFPTTLRSLKITSPYVWNASSVASLPRCLSQLNCESSALSADSIHLLPSQLQTLLISELVPPKSPDSASRSWRRVFGKSYDMQDDARESDEEWDLDMDFRQQDGDEENITLEDDDEDDDEVYKPRPKRIARDFDVFGFPGSLQMLYMRENIHYTPKVFSNLPPALKSFTTGILAKECLHMMPKQLTEIDARITGPVEDGDIGALPKSITTMFLRFQDDSKLTKDVWKCFPELIERTTSYDYNKFLHPRRPEYDRIVHGPIETPDPRVIQRFMHN